MLADASCHKDRNRGRHKGDGQDGSTEQGHEDGQGHRGEHLALDAGQRQDRQIDHGNDQHARQTRSDNAARTGQNGLEPLLARQQPPATALLFCQKAQAVLDNDDSAVDDNAKIDGTKAHQIGADPVFHHAGDSNQH